MAYFADVEAPVRDGAPCGVDLDSDPVMQSYFTATEGSLPSSYRDFDRKSFDDKAVIGQIADFLKQSHDVRLLTLAAKAFALSENFAGFFESLAALATLLERYWDEVHPKAADGSFGLRTAYIQSLEDLPTVLLPLQAAPLIKDKRLGNLSFRALLLSRKIVQPRQDETVREEQVIVDAFKRYEPLEELVALRDDFQIASVNLAKLRTLFISNASLEAAPTFDQLPALLNSIKGFLGDIVTDRSPDHAASVEAGEASWDAGATQVASSAGRALSEIASVAQASQALQAIINYYTIHEPSSPTLLLVRQAHKLLGKSFVEAMQVLAPSLTGEIRIEIAGSAPFALDFTLLQNLVAGDSEAFGGATAADTGEFVAADRNAASDLMRSIERFYRSSEPSSPIPLLLERARRFVARDFTSLLEEMSKRPEQ